MTWSQTLKVLELSWSQDKTNGIRGLSLNWSRSRSCLHVDTLWSLSWLGVKPSKSRPFLVSVSTPSKSRSCLHRDTLLVFVRTWFQTLKVLVLFWYGYTSGLVHEFVSVSAFLTTPLLLALPFAIFFHPSNISHFLFPNLPLLCLPISL